MSKKKQLKMKILLLGSKEYPLGSNRGADPITSGGIEYFVQELAKGLAEAGHEVTLLTRCFPGQKKKEKKGSLTVMRVPWLKGFHLRNPSFNLISFVKALRLDFDIVHGHGPVASFYAVTLARLKKKKSVATPHGIAFNQPQYSRAVSKALKDVEEFAYSRADTIIFLSESEKKKFKKAFGFLPKKSMIMPVGVRLHDYGKGRAATRKALGLGKDFTYCFVGRLSKVKGLDYLLEAIAGMPKTRLLLIGDGPERERLEEEAPSNVSFLGHRTDVPRLLAASDCFILPSLSEGLPVSLLEAMATGLPCIVTDIGLPVDNNKSAVVVPAKNAKALHCAMQRVHSDAKLRKKLAKNARSLAKNYCSKKCSLKRLKAYSPQAE